MEVMVLLIELVPVTRPCISGPVLEQCCVTDHTQGGSDPSIQEKITCLLCKNRLYSTVFLGHYCQLKEPELICNEWYMHLSYSFEFVHFQRLAGFIVKG